MNRWWTRLGMAGLSLLPAACGSPGPLVLCSQMHGQVLDAGQPVAGAAVERRWTWLATGDEGRQVTITGSDGRFQLPAVQRSPGIRGRLPHEPFVEQTIRVTRDGAGLDVWMLDKRNYRSGGELGPGRSAAALVVTVMLDAPLAHRGPVYGHALLSGS